MCQMKMQGNSSNLFVILLLQSAQRKSKSNFDLSLSIHPGTFNVSITACFPSIPVHQQIMSFHPRLFLSRHCVAMNSPVIALQKHCTAPFTCNATTMHNQTILSFEVEIHRLINKSIIKVLFLFKFHPSRQFSNPSNTGFQFIKKPFLYLNGGRSNAKEDIFFWCLHALELFSLAWSLLFFFNIQLGTCSKFFGQIY